MWIKFSVVLKTKIKSKTMAKILKGMLHVRKKITGIQLDYNFK